MSRNSVLLVLVVPALVLALLASLLTQTAHAQEEAKHYGGPDCGGTWAVAYTEYNDWGHKITVEGAEDKALAMQQQLEARGWDNTIIYYQPDDCGTGEKSPTTTKTTAKVTAEDGSQVSGSFYDQVSEPYVKGHPEWFKKHPCYHTEQHYPEFLTYIADC